MDETQNEKRKKQGVRLLLLREDLEKGKNINKEEIKTKFDIDRVCSPWSDARLRRFRVRFLAVRWF